ncbi:MAG: outer membrane beta-barrel protein [Bacteroidales bacterium]|nr:outer membrane beta-barrel protein [Bacteroidales bacterium]
MRPFRIIAAALLFLSGCFHSFAQRGGTAREGNTGNVSGFVYLSPEGGEGAESPGAGVVVLAVTGDRDSLFTQTGVKGWFSIKNIPAGPVTLSFSLLGYETMTRTIQVKAGPNRVMVNLEPSSEEIDAAVVAAAPTPLKVSGDTVVFNAAAVKTEKGERAIDILEQMPGVEIESGVISVLGEAVSEVYVDGALLFGNAPMRALNNLDSDEVVSISSYQEYDNKDPYHRVRQTDEKQRVLDIRTKNRPKAILSGDVLAGGGFNTDSTYRKFRYTAGFDANWFSESLQASISANANNINNDANRRRGNIFRVASNAGSASDWMSMSVSADVKKKWMSRQYRNFVLGQVDAAYSYSERHSVNESATELLYFPSSKWDSRTVERTAFSKTDRFTHKLSTSGFKALKDGRIGLSLTGTFNGSFAESNNTNLNMVSGKKPKGTENHILDSDSGRSYEGKLSFNKGLGEHLRVGGTVTLSASDGYSGTDKRDSTSTTLVWRVLDIDGTVTDRNWAVSPYVRYDFDDWSNLTLSYVYSGEYRHSLRTAFDISDPLESIVDTVNTHDYIVDNNKHSVALTFNNRFKGTEAILRARAGFTSVGLNRDEFFPEEDGYDRRFPSLFASLSCGTESLVNRWKLSWSSSCITPSLTQVRPRLDNRNLLSVSVGNPDLRQSRIHEFTFTYSSPVGAQALETVENRLAKSRNGKVSTGDISMLTLKAAFSARLNSIVRTQIYYEEDTYLPKYDYTMPAQSTLNTYDNAGSGYSAGMNVKYDVPITPILCMLSTSAAFDWDNTPSFYNGTAMRTGNFGPSARLGIRTNFSRTVRFNLSGSASYISSSNTLGNHNEYWTERINFAWELNKILDHFYFGGNYYKRFTQGLEYGDLSDNILNMTLGFRWGPKNNYDLALSAHDVFDNTTGFSTSMTSNYIRNVYTHTFGRYLMLSFAYRFNERIKLKSQ